ncbi:Nucleic-acid-binding protein from transposon X-element [Eumeta japonica]|uniref:Nucleic-acid-binding protein from transposon X-element n=1 Tax=Eumeta variegata TaxID=151549 RepID=A0A4C1WY96_EUMVA|nr:Nucleic-acid-binding protein from transposon X-element [Eumeta japonica]
MEGATSCPSGAGRVVKKEVTHALIKDIVTKALQEMGYECPDTDLDRFVRSATPASSRASSSATSPTSSQTSSQNSTRSSSPSRRNKRRASSSSSEEESGSDNTVVGSGSASDNDSDSVNSGKSATGKTDDSQNKSFTLVKGKNKKAIRKAVKKSKTSDVSPPNVMDVDASRDVQAANIEVMTPTPTDRLPATSTQAAIKSPSVAGAKPTAPPRSRMPPPIFLRKGANFIQISANCTRLRINYSKAVRTADDGIKITCPNVETFRSINKYLVDKRVQFHTYALEEERKIKAVIRGIPTDFPTEEIQNDLRSQGFPVHSVHRLCRRGGSALLLVLAVFPRTEEAKNIFKISPMCVASRASEWRPPIGKVAQVPHWTRDCPLTRDSEEKPSCVNCGQNHTANYRGCPKAPKFIPKHRPTFKRPSNTPSAPRRDLTNFPALPATKPTLVGTKSRPASAPAAPSTNPWTNGQPPQQPRAAAQGPQGKPLDALPRRHPPRPRPRVHHRLETIFKR